MKEEQHLNGLPVGWKWERLGNVTKNLDGKRIPLSKPVRAKRKGEYRYYGATEIVDYIDDYIFDGTYLLIGEDGANLLSKSRPLSFIAEGKFWVNNHAHVLQATEVIRLKYLNYYFNSLNLGAYVTGTAQPKLTQANLNKIPIPLPSIEEQQQIVSKIEELFSELDKGIEELKTAQQQLKVYRQAVLKWAFEGRLTNGNVKDGKLPEGWEWKTVSNVAEKVFDGPFGSHLKSNDYVSEGVRVIRLENIGVLEFKDEYKTYVSNDKYETIKKHTVTEGDIIFSSFIMEETRVVVLPKFIDIAINKADCFCIRANENLVDNHFLAYFLSTKHVYNQLIQEVHGATRPRINTTQLKACLVPYCSLEEQQQIVQEIESRLSVCDKIEETITDSLKQAESLRQSILKNAFEGSLGNRPY